MKYIANPVMVEAWKIIEVEERPESEPPLGRMVTLEDGSTHRATSSMVSRYIPLIGDYWVKQEDGYAYLNPKGVFERKYSAFKG